MTNKLYIWLAITIVILLLTVFYVGKNWYRISGPGTVDLPNDDPTGNGNGNTNELTDSQKAKVSNVTDALYKDINNWNFFHESKPYQDLLSLSDTLFVAVWNEWNKKHYKDGNLRKRLLDEWGNSVIWYHTEFTALKTSIIAKMDKLNLT